MTEVIILVWPDGEWCYEEDIEDYAWKSDDYGRVTCNAGNEEDAVAAFNSIW